MNKNCSYASANRFYNIVLEDIRETIKDKRSKGISVKVLAEELGITREHLSRLLNGYYELNSSTLFYLMERLELRETYFKK